MLSHVACVVAAACVPAGSDTSKGLDESLDILTILDEAVAHIEAQSTPLHMVIEELATRCPVPMTVDWDALAGLNIRPDDRITLRVGPTSCNNVLASLALAMGDQFGRPTIEVHAARIIVTSPSDCVPLRYAFAYDIRDLLADGHTVADMEAAADQKLIPPVEDDEPGNEAEPDAEDPEIPERLKRMGIPPAPPVTARTPAERFMLLLTEHIEPDGWEKFGGSRGRISVHDGTLMVSAPASMHRSVRSMLAQLRALNPRSLSIDAAIVDMPRDEFTRLRSRFEHHGPVLVRAILESPQTATHWKTSSTIALGSELSCHSSSEAGEAQLNLTPTFNRSDGTLLLAVQASLTRGDQVRTISTTLATSVDQAGGAIELPAGPGQANDGNVRLVVIIARPLT